MEELRLLVESYGLNFDLILTGVIIVVSSLIIFAIIKKFFSLAIVLAIIFFILPVMFSWIMDLKSDFISNLPPETGQKVEQSLQDFQDQTIGSGGILDIEAIKEKVKKE